jgi:hypothetical protein
MTNHLANELRGIIADLDTLGTASATDRLVQLIAHVERLHAEPAGTEHKDLDKPVGADSAREWGYEGDG